MVKEKVINKAGEDVGEIDLREDIFEADVNEHLIYEDVVHYLAAARQGTGAAKNRNQKRGGGKKPWRQKGTGRARHGSIRSPLWVGGGIIHGPEPRDFSYSFPKKKQRNALKSALADRHGRNSLIFLEDLELEKPKTRLMVETLEDLEINDRKILLIDDPIEENLELSTRNLQNVTLMRPMRMRAYNALNAELIIFTKRALEKFQEDLP